MVEPDEDWLPELELELELELDDDGVLLALGEDGDGVLGEEDEDDEEEDEGIEGMELWEDCWLVDSQPASSNAAALTTTSCLTAEFFMLKGPVPCR
ncbi:MAG: hypothetical protein Q7V56_09490 [Gammaproteobacteria bacterium]|nr:hypothetical protein [Gammaproteobacteria bacterium]